MVVINKDKEEDKTNEGGNLVSLFIAGVSHDQSCVFEKSLGRRPQTDTMIYSPLR